MEFFRQIINFSIKFTREGDSRLSYMEIFRFGLKACDPIVLIGLSERSLENTNYKL